MEVEAKSCIHRTVIRPTMTYAAENRPETSTTRRILETAEMKVVRRIAGKMLMCNERSEDKGGGVEGFISRKLFQEL